MPLDTGAINAAAGPAEVGWDERDVMLYALGVGAGQADPLAELNLTTENTEGVALQVLPTFALVVAQSAGLRPDIGLIDRSRLVHAEQGLVLHRPLPLRARVRLEARVQSIEDKGSGALVTTLTEVVDSATGEPMFTARAAVFIRGEGGFDPLRQPSGQKPSMPQRAPDIQREVPIRPDQALLYRLCADRNPLHSDPAFAARGGFDRPILHGLCTYGTTVRVLLRAFASGGTAMRSVHGRFTRPVFPGETLTVQGWLNPDGIRFRTLDAAGQTVIDGGLLCLP